jgi:hypothetical protein
MTFLFQAHSIRKTIIWTFKYKSWIPERHGLFTVRSAYNLALDLRNTPPPNSSFSMNGDRPLWNSNVPPKVKKFTWKLATNSLAVQANRSRRIPNILYLGTPFVGWKKRQDIMQL